jgi:hypothetical protein
MSIHLSAGVNKILDHSVDELQLNFISKLSSTTPSENQTRRPTLTSTTMLTQALPYSPQQQQRPLLPTSTSRRSSKRFSLRSVNSTSSSCYSTQSDEQQPEELAATATSESASASSSAVDSKSKNFQNFVRSLRLRKSRSDVFKRTPDTDDATVEADEMEMLSSAERPRDAAAAAAELKAKRSSVDTMLSWALHMYPGAAPVMGWY